MDERYGNARRNNFVCEGSILKEYEYKKEIISLTLNSSEWMGADWSSIPASLGRVWASV